MNPMKVLTVIPEMGAGGAEVVAATIAQALASEGHDSLLASTHGFRVDQLVGVRHLPVPLGSRALPDLFASVRALRAIVRTQRPDVVHAHNPKAAMAARLAMGAALGAGTGAGVPLVTTLHGVAASELGRAAAVLRHSSDRVVAVSPHLAAQLRVHGVPEARVEVIENAVTRPETHDREHVRRSLGLAPDTFVALCAARLVPQKRHDLLVEAWAALPPDTVVLLAGDGPTRPEVERVVAERGLEGRVRLLGQRDDVARLLAASDVLVLPTDWEGLPISVLEAMSTGVPVVVSRVGGTLDTLGEAVRLVEPDSAETLASALRELADDVVARHRLAATGRALAETRFSTERMLAGYRAVLHDAVAAGSAGRVRRPLGSVVPRSAT